MTTPKQFGRGVEPVPFEVDGELFHALPDVPADSVLTIYAKYRNKDSQDSDAARTGEALSSLKELLGEFLYDESYARIVKRMSSKENPIGISTLTNIIQWLMGDVYGLNPTQG